MNRKIQRNHPSIHPFRMIVALLAMMSITLMTACSGSDEKIDPNQVDLEGILVPVVEEKKAMVEENEIDIEGSMTEAKGYYMVTIVPTIETLHAETIVITISESLNHKVVDLTRKQLTPSPRWTIVSNKMNTLKFTVSELMGTGICKNGLMRIDVDKPNKKFKLIIDNLHVQGSKLFGDGADHKLSVNFNGVIQ